MKRFFMTLGHSVCRFRRWHSWNILSQNTNKKDLFLYKKVNNYPSLEGNKNISKVIFSFLLSRQLCGSDRQTNYYSLDFQTTGQYHYTNYSSFINSLLAPSPLPPNAHYNFPEKTRKSFFLWRADENYILLYVGLQISIDLITADPDWAFPKNMDSDPEWRDPVKYNIVFALLSKFWPFKWLISYCSSHV